ncbi:MAG: permease, partial [Polyangia bacterium]
MNSKAILLALLAVVGAAFVVQWLRAARLAANRAPPREPRARRTGVLLLIGVVTDFLDTLGVGSFATTTSVFKLGRVVEDEDIPGTLNVGHALPTLAEAFIYIGLVKVDMTTL